MPSLWSGISTSSVYQDIKTNCSLAETVGLSNDQLYRRQPTNSQLGRGGSIDGRADCDSHGKTGIHSESRQICTRTSPVDPILGVSLGFSRDEDNGTWFKVRENKNYGKNPLTPREVLRQGIGLLYRDKLINDAGHTTSPTVLQSTTSSKEQCDPNSSRLRHSHNSRPLPEGGATVVVGPSTTMEWLLHQSPKTAPEGSDRCVHDWLGSMLSGDKYRWSMVPQGGTTPHQLSGIAGNILCNPVLCGREQGTHHPDTDGQQVSDVLCQQERRDTLSLPHPASKEVVAVVHGQEDQPSSGAHPRLTEPSSRRGVKKTTRQMGLKVEPLNFQQNNQIWGRLTLDLFATRNTTQLERFFSWRLDPQAVGTDAFHQQWGELAFANPPWLLIPRTLSEVRTQQQFW